MGRWCRPRGGLFQRDLIRNGVLLTSQEEQMHRAYLRRRMKRLNPTLQPIPESSCEIEEISPHHHHQQQQAGIDNLHQEEQQQQTQLEKPKKKRVASSSSASAASSMPGFYWVSKIRKLEYSCVERLARLALVL